MNHRSIFCHFSHLLDSNVNSYWLHLRSVYAVEQWGIKSYQNVESLWKLDTRNTATFTCIGQIAPNSIWLIHVGCPLMLCSYMLTSLRLKTGRSHFFVGKLHLWPYVLNQHDTVSDDRWHVGLTGFKAQNLFTGGCGRGCRAKSDIAPFSYVLLQIPYISVNLQWIHKIIHFILMRILSCQLWLPVCICVVVWFGETDNIKCGSRTQKPNRTKRSAFCWYSSIHWKENMINSIEKVTEQLRYKCHYLIYCTIA